MADISRFWQDFNAALWGVFDTEVAQCYAPEESCTTLLTERIADAARSHIYRPYPTGYSLRKLMIECRDVAVAYFVQTRLKQMLFTYLPGDAQLVHFTDQIVLSEEEDGKPLIEIPFGPLILLVRASQYDHTRTKVGGRYDSSQSADLAEGVLKLSGGQTRVVSTLARLQVSSEESHDSCKMLEVDLTERLQYLFEGGDICRQVRVRPLSSTTNLDYLVEYMRFTRGSFEQRREMIGVKIPPQLPLTKPKEVKEIKEAELDLTPEDQERRERARRGGGLFIRRARGTSTASRLSPPPSPPPAVRELRKSRSRKRAAPADFHPVNDGKEKKKVKACESKKSQGVEGVRAVKE